jgi:excisionase family DNA binding protein
MASDDTDWLSTGQAAALCSVTAATVLNWIRTGKIEGVRTPGGHYRIKRDRLGPMMTRRRPSVPVAAAKPGRRNLRCWEYLGERGKVRTECLDCVVYRVRATWCFQIATLGLDTGHSRRFCPTSCDDCSYYRRVQGIPTNVLVVTSDPEVLASLEVEAPEDLEIRFARTAYEASAVVEDFLPAFAVVDLETPAGREGLLLENLGRDPRLPGLKTVVALGRSRERGGWQEERSPFVSGRIEKPFGIDDIRAVIESFPVEVLPPDPRSVLEPFEKGDSP